jgi:cytochrome oxidase Cu insertion factor (SCO1/SenC/PrrC family)
MKKTVFTLIAICLVFNVMAQADTTEKYIRFPTIPAFNITKVPDSSSFTNNQLQKNKPTILFFFNPDCDHCQEETKKLTAKIDQLKDVQILMISILDFNSIKKFYKEYKIADYPNITMARETTYNLPGFYNIHSIPDVYVYDKKGNFLKTFKKTFPVKEIAALF